MAIEEIPSPKKPWQSKTLWLSLITAAAPFVPAFQKIIVEHYQLLGTVLGVLFAGLRSISKGKISIE